MLNQHHKEKYKTLVDKRLIATLEKEIEFLKTEINIKNEIINKFFNNNTTRVTTILWREKHGALMIYSILLILSLFAVQASQKAR